MKKLSRNFLAKILAFVCALSFWVYVSASENQVGDFPGTIPIEAKNTPEGLAAIYDEQRVKVKLQAPFEIWNKLSAENFQATIDLAGLEKGTHEVEVRVTVNIAKIIIVEKDPNRIIVRLEPITSKRVPVTVKFEGEAKAGYVPGEPEITPQEVEASGAESLIESISEGIAKITLSQEDEDFEKTVSVAVYNEKGEKQSGIEFIPSRVKVKVPIVPASESKTVGIKVNLKGRPGANYYVSKIETTPAVVEISGPESSIKPLLFVETREVDISGIDKDTQRKAELIAPWGTVLKTKTVVVRISLSLNTTEREIAATLMPAGTNLAASISPNIVKVVVSGPVDVISSLSSDQVIITFDLSGKGPGSYSVNITKEMISVPSSCSAINWLPSAVTIVLQ